MKFALVGLTTILSVADAATYGYSDMKQIIETVNNANTTWKAGRNFAPDTPLSYYKNLLGSLMVDPNRPKLKSKSYDGTKIPAEFDARKQWPKCPTISHILDQSHCGSCWAVSSAAAFSDRLCIATGANFTTPLSGEQLLSCCDECGSGCKGGSPSAAWNYFVSDGLVTGGDYNSGVGCQPYLFPPCEHHVVGPRPNCSSLPIYDTPACKKTCSNSNYRQSFDQDLHKASSSYSLDTIEAAQEDIMKHGSIVATFIGYQDVYNYKSGVYWHVTGNALGGHAVRVIGWGTENGTPYWLVANSWNSDWGDKGFLKILRGEDECGFESGFVAGKI